MHFRYLEIEIFPQHFGGFSGKPEEGVYAHAEVWREDDRHRFGQFFDRRALLPGMARCSNDGRSFRLATGTAKGAARVGMTEIDNDIAIRNPFRDIVAEIHADCD